jgi:predicted pyridoxine 5'-phosphate oxidase superfamily flavin-nucleotide-binding protein
VAEMTQELMDIVNSNWCYVSTASKDGIPNVACLGSTRAVSPDTIIISIGSKGKTLKNLQENPRASISVYSDLPPKAETPPRERISQARGAQIKGSVTLMSSGDVFEGMKSMMVQRLGPEAAANIQAAVMLKVEEIYNVIPGPDAGKRIA